MGVILLQFNSNGTLDLDKGHKNMEFANSISLHKCTTDEIILFMIKIQKFSALLLRVEMTMRGNESLNTYINKYTYTYTRICISVYAYPEILEKQI